MSVQCFYKKDAKCDVCGEKIRTIYNSMYNIQFRGKKYHMCSYTCYNKALTLKEEKRNDEFLELVTGGKNNEIKKK